MEPEPDPVPNTYRLASEWLPDNRAILDSVLRMPTGWYHPPLTNVNHVHHTDHKVVACAPAFLLLVESGDQVLSHVGSKIGRMQRNDLGLFLEEKHLCSGWRIGLNAR